MLSYFNCHSHTMYSNIRLLDCINRPKALIDKAIELGLSGIAITDHECLSSHMEINQYAKKLRETNPDFTIALGNEIYLTDDRASGQKYYHFILIAKDALGHKALRELSSGAWINSYSDRGMERVPTLKNELSKVVKKYPGHLIATTACLGGELPTAVLNLINAEEVEDKDAINRNYLSICNFMEFCIDLFGEDFYIECAPSTSKEQIVVNNRLTKIAAAFNVKMVIGTDAHYLTKEDRWVHKAYLNSKGGEREVDGFYEFARLMDYEEAFEILKTSFNENAAEETTHNILHNTKEIQSKISFYSLERDQQIPRVKVDNYPKTNYFGHNNDYADESLNWPTIQNLLISDDVQERYWINECLKALHEKDLYNFEYLYRLEIEADIIKHIGNNLHDCLFAYFNTFQHYINLFWECGSIVGPGRGSATGFLSNYLLGITQLDPIRWGLPYWRFLNKERVELPSLLLILGSCKKRTLTIT